MSDTKTEAPGEAAGRARGAPLAADAEPHARRRRRAERLNIGYLSQIENDKALPSLDALVAIAGALEVPAAWLLLDAGPPPRVVRAADRPRLDGPAGAEMSEVDAGTSRDVCILEAAVPPGRQHRRPRSCGRRASRRPERSVAVHAGRAHRRARAWRLPRAGTRRSRTMSRTSGRSPAKSSSSIPGTAVGGRRPRRPAAARLPAVGACRARSRDPVTVPR